jgi:hypothetical protein
MARRDTTESGQKVGESSQATIESRADNTTTNNNTMGGVEEYSLLNVDQFLRRQPCARSSLMYGIGGGAAIGLLQYYRRRTY